MGRSLESNPIISKANLALQTHGITDINVPSHSRLEILEMRPHFLVSNAYKDFLLIVKPESSPCWKKRLSLKGK